MALYVKVNGRQYQTSGVDGCVKDPSWDDRETATIHLDMEYSNARQIFVDDIEWSIIRIFETQKKNTSGLPLFYDPNGEETTKPTHVDPTTGIWVPNTPVLVEASEEYDHSDFCFAGDITDHRDGTLSVKMGKKTDLEEAYEMLFG